MPPASLSYTPSDLFLNDSAEVVHYDPDEAPKTPTPTQRRRAMQLILDEIHGLEKEWIEHSDEGHEEWAAAGIINSSKVVVVTVRFIVNITRMSVTKPCRARIMPFSKSLRGFNS